jgi:ABC-type multidrug transport system ATPase subunit/predicted component of type VI protein secretion system
VRYSLIHLSGSLTGRVRPVNDREVVLGRDPAVAQVVFGPEDRLVSRRHAALRVVDGALVLQDLESSTGTFVGGERVQTATLHDGDVFELGQGGPRVRVEMGDGGTLVVPVSEARAAVSLARAGARPAAAPLPPGARLRLTFLSGSREGSAVEPAGSVIRIGRGDGNAVATPGERVVSQQHAKIVRLEDGFVLIDLESTNGTLLNGERVERARLLDGDVFALGTGGPEIQVKVLEPPLAAGHADTTVVIPNFADLARRTTAGMLLREVVVEGGGLEIGRALDAGLRLDSPIVSQRHARLVRNEEGLYVQDLDSSNGTFVNGARVERARLAASDRVVVGPFELVVDTVPAEGAPVLRLLDTRNRVRLDARGLTVMAGGRPILDDVSLSFPPGSFTAIIGPSGSGKSTLLSALNGARPATRGQVRLNGVDLYRSFEALKSTLGYVPQDDIVHAGLSAIRSLDYTARLRLPPDTTQAERAKRVDQVLGMLELSERRAVPIGRLSGGQRKRVSIATEMLTEPNVLFLDEPTSGLDPGLEESLMLLLRELSYKGKTVVLVTHTLDNIHLCDAVALLVEGRLAFYGPAKEARAYFGIDQMVGLYGRLKERPATQWRDEFVRSEAYRERIEDPLAAQPGAAGTLSGTATAAPPQAAARGAGAWRQLAILTARYFETVVRDGRNALLLVGQAPLIAALIGLSLLYGPSDVAYTKPKNTILFLLALTAVWFGCSNAARELVKERAIYLRERMVNLRVAPYVLSKALVLGALAAVQCVLFLLILDGWFGIPGRPPLLLAAMLLASGVGILLGLALSATVGSADRAMTLLPIVLIPQVLFTIPAVQMDMKGPAGMVARAMPTWWAYDLLRRVALAPDESADNDAVEARLKAGGPVLMTKRRLESMLNDGYPMFQYRGAFETTWAASLPEALAGRLPARWGAARPALVDVLALTGFGLVLFAATVRLQRRRP